MDDSGDSDTAAVLASDVAHRQAAYDADYKVRLTVHQARIEVYQASTERARASAEFCRNSAAAIGTLYGGILGASFAANDGIPMPASGAIPAIFLAFSLALASTYVAYFTSARLVSEPPAPHSSLAIDQERRVNAFGEWVASLVGRRVSALESAVLSLAAGVAFLPAPFIGWHGPPIWAAAAIAATAVTFGPHVWARHSRGSEQLPGATSVKPTISAAAETRRASKLADHGDLHGAEAAWARVVASGHPRLGPNGAVQLGKVRRELGDTAGARAAFEAAIDSADAQAMPEAAYELAQLCEATGDPNAAETAYRLAETSATEGWLRANCAFQLGCLLRDSNLYGLARDAFERALALDAYTVDIGHAGLELGRLLAEQFPTDYPAIQTALQAAIEAPSQRHANDAQLLLGDVLARKGDIDAAADAYRTVIERHFYSHWPTAALRLGDLLRLQGDMTRARDSYALIYAAKDELDHDASSRAALAIAELMVQAGDIDEARDAYEWAARTGERTVAESATAALAEVTSSASQ